MIDTIYIPTYGRVDKQLTYLNLPEHWKKRALLVIHASEKEAFDKLGYPNIVCPNQGPPPDMSQAHLHGIAPTRQWIAERSTDIKYAVLDDDIREFVFTARPSERNNYRLVNTPISQLTLEPGFEDYFDEMMDMLDKWLDEFVTVGLEVTWNPPFEDDYKDCWRQTTNHFYNGRTLPLEHIDFPAFTCAQDYSTLLELLVNGYPNRASLRYRVRPELTQAKGGCESYRTLETHNNAMIKLQKTYPEFVTLKEKVAKGGKWGGMVKLAATIQWKKAYKSSQKQEETSLESMFE